MFKGFQTKQQQFNGFPHLNFQMNNQAYGFSGAFFWLDAAYGLNTQTDLAAVSLWVDRLSNIRFIQETAGNQPRLVASNVNFNNYPTVEVVSNTRNMVSNIAIPVQQGYTIAFVANYNTINGVNAVISNTTTADQIIMGGNSAGAITGVGKYNSSATIQLMGTTESTAPKICVVTNSRLIVDGTEEDTGTAPVTTSFNQIFMSRSISTTNLLGNIAEIIIYDTELTQTECVILSDNINSKYALY